jgi:ribosomal protein S18 acetylase RimI-like enzyme
MSTHRANNEITLLTGGPELVDRIEPLWWQLRQHHADLPTIWRATILDSSFDSRRTRLQVKAPQEILVVIASSGDNDVGYCVSSINNEVGEVESIFVAEAHRRHGVGHSMMLRTMDWFNEKTVNTIVVDILDGNDAAQAFYAAYGFHRRAVRLQKTND